MSGHFKTIQNAKYFRSRIFNTIKKSSDLNREIRNFFTTFIQIREFGKHLIKSFDLCLLTLNNSPLAYFVEETEVLLDDSKSSLTVFF